jgi:hypothetical protein
MLTPHRTVQMVATFINLSTTGDAVVIAATTGQVTSAYRLHLSAAAAVAVQIKLGSTVVDTFQMTTGVPVVLGYEEEPYYVTAVATALTLNLSSAIAVTGQIQTITGV